MAVLCHGRTMCNPKHRASRFGGGGQILEKPLFCLYVESAGCFIEQKYVTFPKQGAGDADTL